MQNTVADIGAQNTLDIAYFECIQQYFKWILFTQNIIQYRVEYRASMDKYVLEYIIFFTNSCVVSTNLNNFISPKHIFLRNNGIQKWRTAIAGFRGMKYLVIVWYIIMLIIYNVMIIWCVVITFFMF